MSGPRCWCSVRPSSQSVRPSTCPSVRLSVLIHTSHSVRPSHVSSSPCSPAHKCPSCNMFVAGVVFGPSSQSVRPSTCSSVRLSVLMHSSHPVRPFHVCPSSCSPAYEWPSSCSTDSVLPHAGVPPASALVPAVTVTAPIYPPLLLSALKWRACVRAAEARYVNAGVLILWC